MHIAAAALAFAGCIAEEPPPLSSPESTPAPVHELTPRAPEPVVVAADAGVVSSPVVQARPAKSKPFVVPKKKPQPRMDPARRISDTADFLQTDGRLAFDGTKIVWTPDNAKDGALTLRLSDVASADGAGDRFTVKMKSGTTHRFKVPSGKGWARDVGEAL